MTEAIRSEMKKVCIGSRVNSITHGHLTTLMWVATQGMHKETIKTSLLVMCSVALSNSLESAKSALRGEL